VCCASSNIRQTSNAFPRSRMSAMLQPMALDGTRPLDRGNPRHPGFHKTSSIDYAIVLSGEIVALIDEGEVILKAGDVLIQRGTNHAWSNRTVEPAYVAFVLIGP
jgi:mannose-6-phosphate isomerase-like protein (cupin superfamily)